MEKTKLITKQTKKYYHNKLDKQWYVTKYDEPMANIFNQCQKQLSIPFCDKSCMQEN